MANRKQTTETEVNVAATEVDLDKQQQLDAERAEKNEAEAALEAYRAAVAKQAADLEAKQKAELEKLEKMVKDAEEALKAKKKEIADQLAAFKKQHKQILGTAPKGSNGGAASAGGRAKFSKDMVIDLLKTDNPRRAGTRAYDIYELYSKVTTVGEFYEAGGRSDDLQWDLDRGNIALKSAE